MLDAASFTQSLVRKGKRSNVNKQWRRLEFSKVPELPRISCLMAPISSHEIVIIGGQRNGTLSSVFYFDTERE